jgi:hypothetical protein
MKKINEIAAAIYALVFAAMEQLSRQNRVINANRGPGITRCTLRRDENRSCYKPRIDKPKHLRKAVQL